MKKKKGTSALGETQKDTGTDPLECRAGPYPWMLFKFNLRSNLNLLMARSNQERSDLRPPNSPCSFSINHHTTSTVKGAIIKRALQLELSNFGLNSNPDTNE